MRTSDHLGKTFLGGGGCSRADCQGTQNPTLIGINFVPTARLAPDKATWYSLKNLSIFKRLLGHSFRGCFFWVPLCTYHQASLFLLPALSPIFSFPIFIYLLTSWDVIFHPPPPPCDDVWKGSTPETAVPSWELSLGRGKLDFPDRWATKTFHFCGHLPPQTHSCGGDRLALSGFRLREKEGERKRKLKGEGNKAAGGIMEKGGKGKGKSEREVIGWLGSGSDRSTVLAFHPLGMETSGNPKGASHFRARRYVYKEPVFRWRVSSEGREIHHYVFWLYWKQIQKNTRLQKASSSCSQGRATA